MKTIPDNSSQSPIIDFLLWFLFATCLITALYLNSVYPDVATAIKCIFVLFLIFMLVAIAFFTKKGRIAYYFALDAWHELQKVVWPAKSEVVQVTWMVSGVIALISLFLWGVDSGISALISYIAA